MNRSLGAKASVMISVQYSTRLSLIFLFLITLLFNAGAALAMEDYMIDMTQPNEYQQWQATNDNVMGGVSNGQLIYAKPISRFEGELSLANNGGFSSINRSIESLSSDIETVAIIVVGDGRRYQLRFSTRKNGVQINYKHEFSTRDGQLQNLEFSLKDFQAVYRGRLIDDAPRLAASDISRVGFLIADKTAGPFSLDVGQIRFKPSMSSQ
ncbi:hypothetical protein VISI1226_08314 [Vibrio sinaloensis DSM 21326]|uniref:NADH:ubiquinone oxidoreductase intermediate-associated protein 30 domain-containing protein n=1 Tax=Vibrio sinaloensis DSM 21326 TaxID=945550 RepID=E8MDD0_PHOS4|nr:hypothetical protein VISI1226_08314 [Vibrio sinaloensis DSM 21326]